MQTKVGCLRLTVPTVVAESATFYCLYGEKLFSNFECLWDNNVSPEAQYGAFADIGMQPYLIALAQMVSRPSSQGYCLGAQVC